MAPARKSCARARPEYSRPLTREKLAAAAIEIVRTEGQAALSTRKVAGRFGVDVAALDRHFQNKNELLAEVGQLASEMVDLEAPHSWKLGGTLSRSGRDDSRPHRATSVFLAPVQSW